MKHAVQAVSANRSHLAYVVVAFTKHCFIKHNNKTFYSPLLFIYMYIFFVPMKKLALICLAHDPSLPGIFLFVAFALCKIAHM